MKASVLIKELQVNIDNLGDLEVDISVAKQPEITQQAYLVASAKYVVPERYEDQKETRIIIRDWPY